MKPDHGNTRNEFLHELGAQDFLIRQLEQQLSEQRLRWETAAVEWRRLLSLRKDLGEWLIDRATNSFSRVVSPQHDAGLRGELFVPGSFTEKINGHQYQCDLISTIYEVTEITSKG